MPAMGVLVVDDDEAIRKTLAGLFADEGYDATEARDGREALLTLLAAERPMVVLLDIKMPTLTGDQVLRFVLHSPELRKHAFIAYTAADETLAPEIRDLLAELGVPLIAKPFDIETLLRAGEEAAQRLSGPQ